MGVNEGIVGFPVLSYLPTPVPHLYYCACLPTIAPPCFRGHLLRPLTPWTQQHTGVSLITITGDFVWWCVGRIDGIVMAGGRRLTLSDGYVRLPLKFWQISQGIYYQSAFPRMALF